MFWKASEVTDGILLDGAHQAVAEPADAETEQVLVQPSGTEDGRNDRVLTESVLGGGDASGRLDFNMGSNREYNAKSVLSVLGAGVRSGDEVEIVCDGEDEEEALSALIELVKTGFGESV